MRLEGEASAPVGDTVGVEDVEAQLETLLVAVGEREKVGDGEVEWEGEVVGEEDTEPPPSTPRLAETLTLGEMEGL